MKKIKKNYNLGLVNRVLNSGVVLILSNSRILLYMEIFAAIFIDRQSKRSDSDSDLLVCKFPL